jgi:hypothetical protein
VRSQTPRRLLALPKKHTLRVFRRIAQPVAITVAGARLHLFRKGARTAIGGEITHQRRGAADCGEFCPRFRERYAASQLLFVIGNAATLVTDACLKGQLCSWLDRTRFLEICIAEWLSFLHGRSGLYRRLFVLLGHRRASRRERRHRSKKGLNMR